MTDNTPEIEKIGEYFDGLRARRVLEEAEDACILNGIHDQEIRQVAECILYLIRNPKKTRLPMI